MQPVQCKSEADNMKVQSPKLSKQVRTMDEELKYELCSEHSQKIPVTPFNLDQNR